MRKLLKNIRENMKLDYSYCLLRSVSVVTVQTFSSEKFDRGYGVFAPRVLNRAPQEARGEDEAS